MARKKNEEVKDVKEVKQESTYVPKKTNKGLVAGLIVVAVFFILVSIVIPIAFMAYVIFYSVKSTEFTQVSENTIEVTNAGIQVSVEDSKYDEKENCYVLSTKVLLTDKNKYNKNINFTDTINVTYSFIDGDGYTVGSETLFIGSLDKYDKWKQTVSFCGDYASSVKSYEVESVDSY